MAITSREIKRLRDALNMTQDEFAKLLGVTRLALHNLETGKSSPRITVRKELEKLLNAHPEAGFISKFSVPIISVDPNLSDEDREFEGELITYFRLLDRETRLKHLKAFARDASMSAKSMINRTLGRK